MRALLLVDIQNDFLPGGALAVPEGDAVVSVANALAERFGRVLATQDWHPADHGSFATNHVDGQVGQVIELNGLPQLLWPVHCVQETLGAAFPRALNQSPIERVFPKGTDAGIDSYSGFFDNGHKKATGLGDHLAERGVTQLYLLGLATDYCVKFTALDARQLGLETFLVLDGCRGVELQQGDVERAVDELRQAGVEIVQSADVSAEERTP